LSYGRIYCIYIRKIEKNQFLS